MLGLPAKDDRKAKLSSNWVKGAWLGRSHINSHIIGNNDGIYLCRPMRSLPPDEDHGPRHMTNLKGTPTDITGKHKALTKAPAEAGAVPVQGNAAGAQPAGAVPPPPQGNRENVRKGKRRLRVEFGRTPGCKGCVKGQSGGRHSLACQARRQNFMREQESQPPRNPQPQPQPQAAAPPQPKAEEKAAVQQNAQAEPPQRDPKEEPPQ